MSKVAAFLGSTGLGAVTEEPRTERRAVTTKATHRPKLIEVEDQNHRTSSRNIVYTVDKLGNGSPH